WAILNLVDGQMTKNTAPARCDLRLGWRVPEWMRLTNTSRATFWRHVKSGDLKVVYIGHQPALRSDPPRPHPVVTPQVKRPARATRSGLSAFWKTVRCTTAIAMPPRTRHVQPGRPRRCKMGKCQTC